MDAMDEQRRLAILAELDAMDAELLERLKWEALVPCEHCGKKIGHGAWCKALLMMVIPEPKPMMIISDAKPKRKTPRYADSLTYKREMAQFKIKMLDYAKGSKDA